MEGEKKKNIPATDVLSIEEKERRRKKVEMMSEKVNERSYRMYLQFFNMKPADLKNKIIFDIGAGLGNFARIARHDGIRLTSIDPIYKIKQKRGIFRKKLGLPPISLEPDEAGPNAIASWAEELPFKDNSCDLALYNFSAFYYAQTKEELRKIITEGLRVLKPGGKMLIFPFKKAGTDKAILMSLIHIRKENPEIHNDFQSIIKELSDEGIIEYAYRDHNIIDDPEDVKCDNPKYLKFMEIRKSKPDHFLKLSFNHS